jgi:hypothetical protein
MCVAVKETAKDRDTWERTEVEAVDCLDWNAVRLQAGRVCFVQSCKQLRL